MALHNPLELALRGIPVTSRRRVIAGAETAIWEYGPNDADTTVVLVHGFRGTHHGLLSLVGAMPEVRFLAPDLPGFGESAPLPRRHDLDGYADWLAQLVAAEDAGGDAVVLGHSFGSLVVARDAARLAPRRIVLVNPIAENALSGPDRLMTGVATAFYRLGAALPHRPGHALLGSRAITRVMSEIMATTGDRALRAWIHDQHRRHFSSFATRAVLLEAFEASVSDEVRAHAAALPAGTVLVAGERDAIAPPDAARRLAASVPESTLHLLGGVGHLIHYEAPLALARVLRPHFAEWGAGGR